jgi:hypothetical protein
MKDISDLKVVGIDESRPAKIRKEPYIELFFKLNHKAAKAWCSIFNDFVSKSSFQIKIKTEEGLFVETWVRKPEEIEVVLKIIQTAIEASIVQYINDIEAETRAANNTNSEIGASGEQLKLNQIIAGLDFS